MMKNVFLLIFCTWFATSLAQFQNSHWVIPFNGGLDFNGGTAQAEFSNINSLACAAVSNQSGQLLFYTDGYTVWNANHTVMTNGTGLLGHQSDYNQNVLIVPNPADINKFYIFSIAPGQNISPVLHGLRYSEVDMGNGTPTVINATKNTPLRAGNGGAFIDDNFLPNYGKITSARHSNGLDYWLIAEIGDEIYSYLIDKDGISAVVTSDAPFSANVNLFPGMDYMPPVPGTAYMTSGCGPMKMAPDNHLILIGYSNTYLSGTTNTNGGRLALGTFDDATGAVSNFIDVPIPTPAEFNILSGAEFSPNSSVIHELIEGYYVVTEIDPNSIPPKIKNISYPLTTIEVRHLQRAQNGLLYFIAAGNGNDDLLSVVNHPNAAPYNLQFNTVSVGSTTSIGCLPSWVQWQPCRYYLDSDLTITSSLNEERAIWIKSTDKINLASSDRVIYHAGNFIELNPGFETQNDAAFTAYIEGCTSNFDYKTSQTNQYDASIAAKANNGKGSQALKLHPNPTKDILYIDAIGLKMIEIQINSIEGKQIKTLRPDTDSVPIEVRDFSSGMYLITIQTDDGQIIRKKFLKN